MGFLTHQNLPLALFLEEPDLGYPAWGGATGSLVSDGDIQSSLGLGIVRFTELPPKPEEAYDVEYRVDTDVITAITISAEEAVTPDAPASVTFSIGGTTYIHDEIVLPEGGSQLAWFKWHTPPEPGTVIITATVIGATVDKATITAKIVDLNERVPPNPRATDRRDGFHPPAPPSDPDVSSLTWGIWKSWWEPKWEWESDWQWESDEEWVPDYGDCEENCDWDCDIYGHWEEDGEWQDYGEYVDNGAFVYEWMPYSATLSAAMDARPDEKAPTASGKTMASGYGLTLDVRTQAITAAPADQVTGAQNVISYYPEFSYKDYCRLSDRITTGPSAAFQLKENPYSTYNRRVHFTPVYYPDGTYTPYATVLDMWCPAGMLTVHLTDTITIRRSVYDDWFMGAK